MNITHTEIDIPVDDPFKNCKLDRGKYASILSDVIDIQSDGFVLAIDSDWGTGKTTFIKMWKQVLEGRGHKTLYFNAWVNDFDTDPLIAILAELKTLSPKSGPDFKALLSKGALFVKNVMPALVKGVAAKYIDLEVAKDTIENLTKSSVEILENEVNDYVKKKKGILDFRHSLEKYLSNQSDGKSLIFFVDELDRCRPRYAVEVLEQIKHFFNVKGVVFVLAIDKEQLSGAINGFYGSEKINSTEYLRRFIDIEYTIPQPSTGVFCKYLIDYYQFDEFFRKRTHPELRGERDPFIKLATVLFEKDKISLRRQSKILAHARLSLNMVGNQAYLFPQVFFLMIYIKDVHRAFYNSIKSKDLSNQEFLNGLSHIFPQRLDKYEIDNLIYLEADLVTYYENYVNDGYRPTKLIQEITNGSYILNVSSSFNNVDADKTLEHALINSRDTRKRDISLNTILEKVDLVQQIAN